MICTIESKRRCLVQFDKILIKQRRSLNQEDFSCVVENLVVLQAGSQTEVTNVVALRVACHLDEATVNRVPRRVGACWRGDADGDFLAGSR